VRVRLIVASIVVLAVQAIVAWGLAIMSVHGPSGLTIGAVIYLPAAWALTVWVAARNGSTLALVGIGLASVAIAPGIIAALDRIEEAQTNRRIAATRISDVRDEPILSSTTGRPIGIRVSFSATVPSKGYFGFSPWLNSRDPKAERLTLAPAFRPSDRARDETPYRAGETRRITYEVYPDVLAFWKDERCLVTNRIAPLSDSTVASPLAISISSSRYGSTYHGGREEHTTGSYDVVELYRGVLAEGLKPCPTATASP
jgi:hypothetical protein